MVVVQRCQDAIQEATRILGCPVDAYCEILGIEYHTLYRQMHENYVRLGKQLRTGSAGVSDDDDVLLLSKEAQRRLDVARKELFPNGDSEYRGRDWRCAGTCGKGMPDRGAYPPGGRYCCLCSVERFGDAESKERWDRIERANQEIIKGMKWGNKK